MVEEAQDDLDLDGLRRSTRVKFPAKHGLYRSVLTVEPLDAAEVMVLDGCGKVLTVDFTSASASVPPN